MSPKWLVIADGAKAQIFSYNGFFRTIHEVPEGDLSHVNLLSQELITDKQGRVFNSADNARSAMEPTVDPHEQEKVLFAKEVADFLKARNAQFNQLALVAAPRFLGYLRKALPDSVQRKVNKEVSKDFTNISKQELPEKLKDAFADHLYAT